MSETIVIKIDRQLFKQKICGDCHQRKDLSVKTI